MVMNSYILFQQYYDYSLNVSIFIKGLKIY
jgi:hypothetical protein